MAGIEQWFQFESKDDKEANRKKYFQKMFPYGEEQKTADEKMVSWNGNHSLRLYGIRRNVAIG